MKALHIAGSASKTSNINDKLPCDQLTSRQHTPFKAMAEALATAVVSSKGPGFADWNDRPSRSYAAGPKPTRMYPLSGEARGMQRRSPRAAFTYRQQALFALEAHQVGSSPFYSCSLGGCVVNSGSRKV